MQKRVSKSHKLFIQNLKDALLRPLPGEEAQNNMAPAFRFKSPTLKNPVKAGVLLLFYEKNQELTIVFTRRNVYEGHHSGQVSFPGGKEKASDKNILFTALRECEEEIGVDPNRVELLGNLSPLFIPLSNHYVFPVIGYCKELPSFQPDKREVNYLIECLIKQLLIPENRKKKYRQVKNMLIETPYYDINNEHIWGATAMIISEFISLIEQNQLNRYL